MKKLLTFLGTGNYEECIYTVGEFKSQPTRFVQTAIFEYLESTSEEIDEVYVFVTKEAKTRSYYDRTEIDRNTEEEIYYKGLENTWKDLLPDYVDKIKLKEISSKQSEEAQWELFESIFDSIEEGDELYVDITHSFRSIPLITLLVSNFARLIKNASFKGLFYGNIEVLGNPWEIKNIPLEERLSPIENITSMVNLLDWSIGVESFIRTGNPIQIFELAENKVIETVDHEERRNVIAMKNLMNQLLNFNKMMETSRGIQFHDGIKKVKESLEEVKTIPEDAMPQVTKLMDEIERKVDIFTDDPNENKWNSIKWCVDHGLYQQAITLMREHIITIVFKELDQLGLVPAFDSNKKGRRLRDNIGSIINYSINPEASLSEDILENYANLIDPIKEIVAEKEEAYRQYSTIINYRNNINHAEQFQDNLRFITVENNIKRITDIIKPIFFE